MKRAPKSAVKVAILDNSDPISAEKEAILHRIRQRAFELSQARPHNSHEIYDWMMAESEVISVPPAELIEKHGTFELKFAVAGVSPDDVNLLVTPGHVLLKSTYNHRHESDSGTVHLCDFKSATVFRSVDLPEPIDPTTVKVDVADGIVFVTASKGSSDQSPKRTMPARRGPAKKTQSKLP
jgi:HSP20 family molecular chaperone IbpA